MGRRNRRPLLAKVEILETAAEGKSLAKVEDKVVFVTNAVPGDIVDVQVVKKRRKYMEGKAVKFHQYSSKRIEPICSHFGVCGGCKWQFISYEEQLKNKQKVVIDSLERMAKVNLPDIPPILGSQSTEFYRNKMEFTFSNKEWLTEEQIKSGEIIEDRNALGFHVPGRFDKVLNVDKCYLQAEPSNEIRNWVRAYALENQLPFFDLKEQVGLMRNLIIRTSRSKEVMVIVAFARPDHEAIDALMYALEKAFPSITSLNYVINEKRNDTILDQEVICYSGRDFIYETMPKYLAEGELKFKVGPKSFYQTNSEQAHQLYKVAAEFADIQDTDLVYDFYTGTGTIANFVAPKAKSVIGVEYVEAAIDDAKINSEINGIENTTFYAGDMKEVFTEAFIQKHGKADVIITDPPRAGMHQDVIDQLLSLEAPKIVYVSCNPATQARDIAALDEKYAVEKVQAVDMFPQTHHVENVVLLKLKS